ncbi:uncharacterized protein AMSG_02828 [Thecamonas trahens ATCC 50062]|uniref:Intraflagellar transport protein 43 n=1 Tax=Thecamonas trahens ATCC 50062 TaxID=461836 RepID=A0A0L0D2F7_THETB|nr:hypothetical protein AMSG_02828 [Thecamonas trahens ATCC 50062]KNC46376.1 hypothetical protein AMSG_02828 [Thecamonas trahens ATCC 50062]|eukprot:XP_013760669.1 hypothetical protein AMSG_02828 [Thecamonas trahens ATCC 50062]
MSTQDSIFADAPAGPTGRRRGRRREGAEAAAAGAAAVLGEAGGKRPGAPSTGWGQNEPLRKRGNVDALFGSRAANEDVAFGAAVEEESVSTDDGVAIPDLEDVQREERMGALAQAPTMAAAPVQSIDELDLHAGKLSHVAIPDPDLDLSLLTDALMPLEAVQDPEAAWDWASLFRHVSNEISQEAAHKAGAAARAAASTDEGVSALAAGTSDGNMFALE